MSRVDLLDETKPSVAQPAYDPEASPQQHITVLLAVYGEVCTSYHAIDDFRTKLLGILPITSIAGILALGHESLIETSIGSSQRLIGFASFFGAAFTLALFLFEIRGIIRCHHLITRGEDLEQRLQVRGQFFVCAFSHRRVVDSGLERFFNAKVAASAMYSLVFAAWFFLALKFTFGFALIGCGLTAVSIGGLLALAVHHLLGKVAAS